MGVKAKWGRKRLNNFFFLSGAPPPFRGIFHNEQGPVEGPGLVRVGSLKGIRVVDAVPESALPAPSLIFETILWVEEMDA